MPQNSIRIAKNSLTLICKLCPYNKEENMSAFYQYIFFFYWMRFVLHISWIFCFQARNYIKIKIKTFLHFLMTKYVVIWRTNISFWIMLFLSCIAIRNTDKILTCRSSSWTEKKLIAHSILSKELFYFATIVIVFGFLNRNVLNDVLQEVLYNHRLIDAITYNTDLLVLLELWL